MKENKKIHIIQYLLFGSIFFIQVIILIFFYNEFYNQSKVDSIEDQLLEINTFQNIIEESRLEVFNAQKYLQSYVSTNQKKQLHNYFLSLERLVANLDTIDIYKNKVSELDELIRFHKRSFITLPNLRSFVDSVYEISKLEVLDNKTLEIERFIFKDTTTTEIIEVNVEHKTDSLPQKNFIARLKDAINNTVDVKKEVTIITTKHIDTLNTHAIIEIVDSIINVINLHYENELNKFKIYNSRISSKYEGVYKVYGELIQLSTQWMELYTLAIQDFSKHVRSQYFTANTKVSSIRQHTIFALMVLMFIVLAIMIFYNRQAVRYEKQLQQANQSITKNLEFKNRILAMLNHEMRSPLHIINLLIDRIRAKNTEEKVIGYLDSVKYANNQLLLQSNQILEYIKNEQKEIPVILSKVSLKQEIRAILEIFESYIAYKNNQYVWEENIADTMVVMTDIVKIRQLFINLIGNANKFTDSGTITVKVASEVSLGKLQLSVVVEDTGIGISEQDLKNLFTPFYQGIISDKVVNLGVGLGLNLCKEIIEKLGGSIDVQSAVNKGTTVTFRLKMKIIDE